MDKLVEMMQYPGRYGLRVDYVYHAHLSTFDPRHLFAGGKQGWLRESFPYTGSLYQDAAGTTPSVSDLDYIGLRQDRSGNGIHESQSASTARGQLKKIGGHWFTVFDLTDDAYDSTVPAITGGQIAIFTSVGAWFDSFDSATGAFAWGPTTYTGGPANLLDALKHAASDYREIAVIARDDPLTVLEKKQLLAYYGARGCPGEIILESSLIQNGDGQSIVGWDTFSSNTSGSITADGSQLILTSDTPIDTTTARTRAEDTQAYQEISTDADSWFLFAGEASGNIAGSPMVVSFDDAFGVLSSIIGGQALVNSGPYQTLYCQLRNNSGISGGVSYFTGLSLRKLVFP